MMQGTKKLLPELREIYGIAWKNATREEKQYIPIIEKRIDRGSLAEVMIEQHHEAGSIKLLLSELAESLKNNTPYFK